MSDEEPPDARAWWWHRRLQSYLGIAGLSSLAAMAIHYPVSEASAELLSYAGLGCLLLIGQYMGSTVEDLIRAWREGKNGNP